MIRGREVQELGASPAMTQDDKVSVESDGRSVAPEGVRLGEA